MSALLLEAGDGSAKTLMRDKLDGGRDEKWLQALLFAHPELVPLDSIDPGAGRMIPICRELPIPKPGGNVFLDLFGVTAHGRLALVECKLWRNPQARREVIAQLLEYAALLRRWSYADLTARLKTSLGWSGPNPLFDHVRDGLVEADEAHFVDAVSRSLKGGDFDLIIAGDGIREDLGVIAEHLGGQGARLALVEFQLWSSPDGCTLVVPNVPLRTEVIRQRVIVDNEGVPLRLEDATDGGDDVEAMVDPQRASARDANRAFWQRFIDTVRFDHPDQSAPRHGGNNWVKIPMPPPASGITAYRSGNAEAGLFLTLEGDDGVFQFGELEASAHVLRDETGLDLIFSRKQERPFRGTVSVVRPLLDFTTVDDQLAWFRDVANRLVNAFRTRTAASTSDVR